MTLQQLTEMIRTADKKAITKALKQLGYIDCAKNKAMRHINICALANSDYTTTEVFTTKNGKYEYYGDICTNVKGFENLEFVAVSINKIYKDKDLSFPYEMFVFAKENKK